MINDSLKKRVRWLVALVFFMACKNSPPNKPKVDKVDKVNEEDRVAVAYAEKESLVQELLQQKGIDGQPMNLFLRAFKKEQILEVWAKNKAAQRFTKIRTYDFCNSSGVLGPKRKEGDLQIPEGFYHIDLQNPKSIFYLSLRINYPNASDKIRGEKDRLGNDIFIHGGCATIGCIPITNDKIKELYVLVDLAKKGNPEEIRIHLLPTKMTTKNLRELAKDQPNLLSFWQELQEIDAAFEKRNILPRITVSSDGTYQLQK